MSEIEDTDWFPEADWLRNRHDFPRSCLHRLVEKGRMKADFFASLSLMLGIISFCACSLPVVGLPLAVFGIGAALFGRYSLSRLERAILGGSLAMMGLILSLGFVVAGRFN